MAILYAISTTCILPSQKCSQYQLCFYRNSCIFACNNPADLKIHAQSQSLQIRAQGSGSALPTKMLYINTALAVKLYLFCLFINAVSSSDIANHADFTKCAGGSSPGQPEGYYTLGDCVRYCG